MVVVPYAEAATEDDMVFWLACVVFRLLERFAELALAFRLPSEVKARVRAPIDPFDAIDETF